MEDAVRTQIANYFITLSLRWIMPELRMQTEIGNSLSNIIELKPESRMQEEYAPNMLLSYLHHKYL